MIRNLCKTSWGEYLLPYQFQPLNGATEESLWDDPNHPAQKNGVLISRNPDGPWTQSDEITGPGGWAEVNVAELSNRSLAMLCRSGEGLLRRTDSTDRGRSWSAYRKTKVLRYFQWGCDSVSPEGLRKLAGGNSHRNIDR